MNSSPPYLPTKSFSGSTLRKSAAKFTISLSPAECPIVSLINFKLFKSNTMHAVGSLIISLLLRISLHELLFGNPVRESVYAFCSSSLFCTAIFIAARVCITTNITRHIISSADKISILRIFIAIFSEYFSAAETVSSAMLK